MKKVVLTANEGGFAPSVFNILAQACLVKFERGGQRIVVEATSGQSLEGIFAPAIIAELKEHRINVECE